MRNSYASCRVASNDARNSTERDARPLGLDADEGPFGVSASRLEAPSQPFKAGEIECRHRLAVRIERGPMDVQRLPRSVPSRDPTRQPGRQHPQLGQRDRLTLACLYLRHRSSAAPACRCAPTRSPVSLVTRALTRSAAASNARFPMDLDSVIAALACSSASTGLPRACCALASHVSVAASPVRSSSVRHSGSASSSHSSASESLPSA